MPKSIQAKAKQHIYDIWMAETREDADKAFDLFIEIYQLKYPKACECLEKDRDQLLAFYDFPAEHWIHIRTSNPIESTFASVRGCYKLLGTEPIEADWFTGLLRIPKGELLMYERMGFESVYEEELYI